jgi:predicted nucleic acid-binding protein
MRALLDINVLIALHDRDHVHHIRAAEWFEAHIEHGWASCPLTQKGCLSIMSQPANSGAQPLAPL